MIQQEAVPYTVMKARINYTDSAYPCCFDIFSDKKFYGETVAGKKKRSMRLLIDGICIYTSFYITV